MKIPFRLIGILLLIVGIPIRLQPRMLMPSFIGWSGEFALSSAGQIFFGIGELAGNAVLVGCLLIILSFTSLTDKGPSQ